PGGGGRRLVSLLPVVAFQGSKSNTRFVCWCKRHMRVCQNPGVHGEERRIQNAGYRDGSLPIGVRYGFGGCGESDRDDEHYCPSRHRSILNAEHYWGQALSTRHSSLAEE